MVRVYITLFALLNHGPFKLSERVGYLEKSLTRWRCGIHALIANRTWSF